MPLFDSPHLLKKDIMDASNTSEINTDGLSNLQHYSEIAQSIRDLPEFTNYASLLSRLFKHTHDEMKRLQSIAKTAQEFVNLGASSLARELMMKAGSSTGDSFGPQMSNLLEAVILPYAQSPYTIQKLAAIHGIDSELARTASTLLQQDVLSLLPPDIIPIARPLFESIEIQAVTEQPELHRRTPSL